MIKVRLRDEVKEFEEGISVFEIAKSISEGLARVALSCKINGELKDLRTCLDKDCEVEICTFDSEAGKHAYWHTSSHILAQAVKRLYPHAHFAIGPAIDNGFYYDIDFGDTKVTNDDLAKIEEEMIKITKEDQEITCFVKDSKDAIDYVSSQGEIYKKELIEEHAGKGEKISFYTQGEFTDLCAGPHVMSTGKIGAIKLLSITSAYWRGDSKNKALTRIYGISFPKKKELTEYLEKLEEARSSDHNVIGRQLEYFTTVPCIGQGLPLLIPNGARMFQVLTRFIEDEEQKRGYQLTKTPLMSKSDLFKISGHWSHYKDGMFVMGDEEKDDEVYALRPMTCPFQFQYYLMKKRSYRELPMRLNETSTLFRNEASGEMHGLIRVRQFTLSEGHIICTKEQLEDEFAGAVELQKHVLKCLGLLDDVTFRLSCYDPNDREKYIGSDEEWERTQNLMKKILEDLDIDYKIGIGEAAFYGPKLDVQIRNVWGKEDTLVTVQIDPMLAERFNMVYTDKDDTEKHPYIVHRSSLGCYERTMALLIEKYKGAMPLWFAPEQARILPISDKFIDDAKKFEAKLAEAGIRVTVDTRAEKIGYKIREAQLEKVPYMLVLGEKEASENTIAVRKRGEGDIGTMAQDEFISLAVKQVNDKEIW